MTHPAPTTRIRADRARRVRVVAALAAATALQACAPKQQAVHYDPWNEYALGKVYDCGDIQQPDFRTNTENSATPGFGCSHQSNLTLMASDPADLTRPRAMTPADETARQRVLQAYRAGESTNTAPAARGTRSLVE